MSATIFFDIGGTLLHNPDIFEVIARKLSDRWPDPQTYELVQSTYGGFFSSDIREGGRPFVSITDSLATALGLLAGQYGYRDISADAANLAVDVYAHQSTLYPETEGVLEKLLKCGVNMVIASDNDRAIFAAHVSKHRLDRYFDHHVISEEVRAYKPTIGFIAGLRKYIPKDPRDCYFVGDTRFDVECGESLGIKSVLVDRKHDGNTTGADYVIHDLSELLPILNLK